MKSVPADRDDEDPDYYVRRAETQLELAQRTENPTVVAAHYAIADRYLELEAAKSEAEGTAVP